MKIVCENERDKYIIHSEDALIQRCSDFDVVNIESLANQIIDAVSHGLTPDNHRDSVNASLGHTQPPMSP